MQSVHVNNALMAALFQKGVFNRDKIFPQSFKFRLRQGHLEIVDREARTVTFVKKKILELEQLPEINFGRLQKMNDLDPALRQVALRERLFKVQNIGFRLGLDVMVHMALFLFFKRLSEFIRHFLPQTLGAQIIGGLDVGVVVGWELRLVVGVKIDV